MVVCSFSLVWVSDISLLQGEYKAHVVSNGNDGAGVRVKAPRVHMAGLSNKIVVFSGVTL